MDTQGMHTSPARKSLGSCCMYVIYRYLDTFIYIDMHSYI